MASEQLVVSFGDELKDGYKSVDAWVGNGTRWLEDIIAFYRERSLIEKEYATKMQALSAKYFEKKAKLSTSLSVGDTPVITPGSLENASLVAWTEILTQTEQIGKERSRLSNELSLQIADQINGIQTRFDDLRKKYATFNERLITERDNHYNERKRAKQHYDAACQKMEDTRAKASRSYEKDKATKKMGSREIEMNNAKNSYLIKINIANRIKDKYYHEDVPEMLDGLQALNEARVGFLNGFWKQAAELEQACLTRTGESLQRMTGVVAQNKPTLDSAMFVKHNIAQWTEPTDFYYEPSPIWHDDERMIVDDDVLGVLRGRLNEADRKLADATTKCETKASAFKETVELQREATANAHAQGASVKSATNAILLLNKQLQALSELTSADTERVTYEVEVETINAATSDKDMSSVPVTMTKTRRGLLGLGRKKEVLVQAKEPVSDGASTHSKRRSSHHGFSVSAILGRSRSRKGGAAAAATENATHAKALYAYTATGDDEMSINEGEDLVVLQPDDGSGWVKVEAPSGNRAGLVPATYIDILEPVTRTESRSSGTSGASGSKKKGPSVAPKRGGKKVEYMVAVYDFDATAPDELTIRTGDKIVIMKEDSGDGWTVGELNGMSGSFPTSYAQRSS